jgi:hypothetical protein
MKKAGPFSPEEARFKRSEQLSKMTLHAYATVINSTMVTSHGPKMVQGFTERLLKKAILP